MTRIWDPNLGQYRDTGRFAGNDEAAAAGGMNALGGDHDSATIDSQDDLPLNLALATANPGLLGLLMAKFKGKPK